MYSLPPQTLVHAKLAKTSIYSVLTLTAHQRRTIDEDVSRVDIVAQFSPSTLPALKPGKTIDMVSVVRLTLKRDHCADETLRLLSRIPQMMVFALSFAGKVSFALSFASHIFRTQQTASDEAVLCLEGTSVDTLWLSLVAQVAALERGSRESLVAQIQRREQLARLTSQRDRTEAKMWQERQSHRRNELYDRLQELNRQIDELSISLL